MLVKTYNQKGEEGKKTKLIPEIFEVKINQDLVHQVIVSQRSTRRKRIAHTKDRGDVRGGGRKPWRQKGLGKARHGSIRSPIWAGGGVTFGPRKEKIFTRKIPKKMKRKALFMVLSGKVKNNLLVLVDELKLAQPKTKEFLKKIPKKMKRKALFMVLSGKVKNNLLVLVDELKLAQPKTKEFLEILKNLPCKNGSSLIALPKIDKNIILSVRNIPKVETMPAKDLNCLDLLTFKYLVMPKESIKVISETFLGSKNRVSD